MSHLLPSAQQAAILDALAHGDAAAFSQLAGSRDSSAPTLQGLKDVLNLGNPLSRDYFWWQLGRKVAGQPDTSPSLVAGAYAPDWFFWGSIAAAAAGGVYLYKRHGTKGRR